MRTVRRRHAPAAAALALLAACDPQAQVGLEGLLEVARPLEAYCQAQVQGVGLVDVEEDYLPHVVTCENGGAPLESLKAQAVAARTYLYYKLGAYGSIRDGTSDQVYSCSAEPGELQRRAVRETAGQFLSYRGGVICAFFVAGARQTPPSCQGGTSDGTNTERYVTYNWGLSGGDVHQTTLGWVSSTNHANRGCFSQWGSRCLADAGWDYQDILHFYYGMDARLETATGACVAPPAPVDQPPRGHLDAADAESLRGWAQDPDAPAQPIDVHLYVGGPAGDAAAIALTARADLERADLCTAIGSCAHGFARPTPRGLCDGQERPVYAYGIDRSGGANALLGSSPRSLRCAPPPVPLEPAAGLLRWIPDPTALAAWRLSTLEDLAHVDDAVLAAYRQGPALPATPRAVRADDGTPEVWLLDSGVRRHVPDAQAFAAWRLAWEQVASMDASALYALPQGAPWTAEPFLLQGSGPAVYVLDVVEAMGEPAPDAGAATGVDAGAGDDAAGEGEDDAGSADAAPGDDVEAGVPLRALAAPPPGPEVVEVGEGMGCASQRGEPSGLLALALLVLVRRRR